MLQRWFRSAVLMLVLGNLAMGLSSCRRSTMPYPEAPNGHEEGSSQDGIPVLSAINLKPGERLRVVASTSLVGDVVQQVGAERIELQVLVPPGSDPHGFIPAPQDAVAVARGHVVFINGAGLETFLDRLLESAGVDVPIVPVSHGITLLEGNAHSEPEAELEEEDRHSASGDPHTWFAPRNVITWTQNIAMALSLLDPANGDTYEANAAAYSAQLEELDAWVVEQVNQIPLANRKLVTDHTVFTYFAQAYGFEQVGAVIPGYSTLAAPSAQELARLEDAIRQFAVPAVFVGVTVNSTIAQRVAQDTGVQLVQVYHGSLSEMGGPADNYLEFMRYNVNAIVGALR